MSTIVVPFHLDQRIDRFESPLGVDRTVAPELPSGGAWGRMAALYEDVAQAVSGDPAPIVVSGDCTTSIATVAGLAQAGDSPGIVWLDAHGDFNTEETTESGYLGGMPLAKICGLGDLGVVERLGLAPVATGRALLVGARDLDPAEDELLASAAVRRASVEGLRVDDLPAGPLYLHLDVDVADPPDLPGLLFPRPWRSWPERADRCGRDGCELGPARRGRGRAHLGRGPPERLGTCRLRARNPRAAQTVQPTVPRSKPGFLACALIS